MADAAGNLFLTVADASGATSNSGGYGRIYELPAGGSTLQSLFIFGGSTPLLDPRGRLFVEPDGTLVGSCYESFSGQNGGGVYTFDPSTDTFTTEVDTPTQKQIEYVNILGGPAVDSAGNIYFASRQTLGTDAEPTVEFVKESNGGASTGSLAPTVSKSTVPATAVVGAKPKRSTVSLTVTNSSSARVTGTDTFELYATTTGVIDSSSKLVGQSKASPSIQPGKSAKVTVAIPSLALSAGTYTILPRVLDKNGAAYDGSTGPTVTLAPATVTLAASIGAVTPVILKAGKTISIALTLTNTGNTDAKGLTITLGLSADGGATIAIPFTPMTKATTIKATGRPLKIKLTSKLPSTAAAGTYTAVATVASGSATASAVGVSPVTIA